MNFKFSPLLTLIKILQTAPQIPPKCVENFHVLTTNVKQMMFYFKQLGRK